MYYFARKIILEDRVLKDSYMEVKGSKVVSFTKDKPQNYEDLGEIIAPGLVDTHIHGYAGRDLMDFKEGSLNEISKGLLECGVTSFIPTSLTASTDELDDVCKLVGDEFKNVNGARVRGLFLEGPFFTDKYKGAQNSSYMEDPNLNKLERWKDLSAGLLNKIALAPERKGSIDFIKKARSMGIKVGLGHSDASYKEALRAVDAGANIFIHTYNAMSGLHHRKPGMVGACMNTDSFGEIICDGYHVDKLAVDILMKIKGKDKIVLISDCMEAGGRPEGEYKLGKLPVLVKNGQARLKGRGKLAGSVLKLNQAVKNIVDWGLADFYEAIQMASLNPAKSLAIDKYCGKLKEGYEADFIVLDKSLELRATYLGGKKVFEKNC